MGIDGIKKRETDFVSLPVYQNKTSVLTFKTAITTYVAQRSE